MTNTSYNAFEDKRGITFWWQEENNRNYISTWYEMDAPYLTSVPARKWNKRPLEILPLNATDPSAGYVLGDLDWYVSTKSKYNLLLTQKWSEAAIVLPVLDDSGTTIHLKQHPSQGTGALTLDTRGFTVCFEPYQAKNTSPIIQHFAYDLQEDDRQYFWILNTSTGEAVQLQNQQVAAGTPLTHGEQLTHDSQLFRVIASENDTSFQLACKLNGFVIDCKSDEQQKLAVASPPVANKNSQVWTYTNTNLVNMADSLVLTASSDSNGSITLSSPANQPTQQWAMSAFVPYPTIDTNQFEYLQPGTIFALKNGKNNLAVTVNGNAVTVETINISLQDNQLWTYKQGYLYSLADKTKVLDVNDARRLVVKEVQTHPRAQQTWVFTGDGFLLNKNSKSKVAVMQNTNAGAGIIMQTYDALGKDFEFWSLATEISSMMDTGIATRDLETTNIDAGAVVKTLKVKMTISDDWFAGTSDDIYVALNIAREHWVKIMSAPSRGDSNEVSIDLAEMFPGQTVRFKDLNSICLGYEENGPGVVSDQGKIQSIILIATGPDNNTYYNNSFQQLNKWSNPEYKNLFNWDRPVSWNGYFSWAAWSNEEGRPIDIDLNTYSIGLIPWIGDILSWRTYDPSTIDGVGLLVGFMNDRIVGDQLKSRQTEILKPGPYTWVYVPDGDCIIYKFWDKEEPDRTNYTRHSQLASGEDVICAGEWKIVQNNRFWTIQSIIIMVNDASGHYKPDGGASLKYVLQKLQLLGIATDQTKMYWRSEL